MNRSFTPAYNVTNLTVTLWLIQYPREGREGRKGKQISFFLCDLCDLCVRHYFAGQYLI